MPTTAERLLHAGRDALRRGDWQEAVRMLREADGARPLTAAEDLEGLAEAADWSGLIDVRLQALERVYRIHREEGRPERAALTALVLATEHGYKLSTAVAAGWRACAEHLLEGLPECAVHGHLAIGQALTARHAGDLDRAEERARFAGALGQSSGDRNLWGMALHVQGQVLLQRGAIRAGMALIDEVSAAAVGGELTASAMAYVYCWTISACRDIADLKRAAEWTEAVDAWCERESFTGFPGVCRVYRSEILRLRGTWTDALREARRACHELETYNPAQAGVAFAELGEVHLRLGDLGGADAAFSRARQLGTDPQPGCALLHLARGDARAALSSIRQAVAGAAHDRFKRGRMLPALAHIGLTAGDHAAIADAAAELAELATICSAQFFEAAATEARGMSALAGGGLDAARHQLQRAVRIWHEVGAPYESAQARVLLARALVESGDGAAATAELGAAVAVFQRLGAAPAAAEALRLLDRTRDAGATPERKTFLFTDIVQSSALLEAIGDEAWGALLSWHDRTLRHLFAHHGGREIDHAGDGFFVAFDAAGSALDCAVDVQRTLAEHRRHHGFAPRVRVGVHASHATRSGETYRGRGVHEAARIAALGDADEVLVSASTFDAAGGAHAAPERRTATLRGLRGTIEIVVLDWR